MVCYLFIYLLIYVVVVAAVAEAGLGMCFHASGHNDVF